MRVSRQHLRYALAALVLAVVCLVMWHSGNPGTVPSGILPGSGYPIEITESALQHVIDRHTVGGSMTAGKSIFSSGENVRDLIKDAELLAPTPQDRGNYQRVVDAGRTIGIDRRTGQPTSTYTVITTESGKLVTAFPGLP